MRQYRTQIIRYVTRKQLSEIANKAEKWNFNQFITPEELQEIPDEPDAVYHVMLNMLHEHRKLQPCELHMRILIDKIALVDVPLKYFNALPNAHIVICDNVFVAGVFEKCKGRQLELRYCELAPTTICGIHYLMQHTEDGRIKDFLDDLIQVEGW